MTHSLFAIVIKDSKIMHIRCMVKGILYVILYTHLTNCAHVYDVSSRLGRNIFIYKLLYISMLQVKSSTVKYQTD